MPDSKPIAFRNQHGFPPTICVQLLKWCNLKCANCRAGSSPIEKEQLRLTSLQSLLSALAAYGDWRISLTGGEPFFWEQLPALLKTIKDLGFPFSITTNGFANKRVFDCIPSEVWDRGTLYVSVDGNRAIHDSYRVRNSYGNAFQFIKHCRSIVPKINVNTVLYSNPDLWLEELYIELVKAKIDNWTIISPVRAGRTSYLPHDNNKFSGYQSWYDKIREYVLQKERITTTFLDFAATQGVREDVVFINSDGSVRLPGLYSSETMPVKLATLDDEHLSETIAESVNLLVNSNEFIR